MLNKIRNAIANDNELSSESLRFLSLIALAISGSMSLFKYTQESSIDDDAISTYDNLV